MAQGKNGAQGRAQNPDVLREKPSFKDNGLDALKRDVEAQEKKRGKNPEVHEEAKDKALDFARSAREVERSDLEQAQDLNKIDVTKIPETKEEKERMFYLRDVSLVCLSVLLAKNKIRVDQIKNFDDFTELNLEGLGLNATEKAALSKLQELAGDKNSPLHDSIAKNWSGFVNGAFEHSKKAAEQAAQMKKEVSDESKGKGIVGKAIDTVKAHPIATAAVVAGGALALYLLLRKSDAPTEKAKAGADNESGWDTAWKWGKRLLFGAGIAFAAGRILEFDSVQKWIKKTVGWDISNNKWIQALTLASHGEFKKAWDTLSEGQENAKLYDKVIENIEKEKKVKVSRRTLEKISSYKYGDFTQDGALGFAGEIGEFVGDKIDQLPIISGMLDLSGEEREEAKTVREYLKDHDKDLRASGVTNDMTLVQVFAKITGEKLDVARDVKKTEEYKGLEVPIASIKDLNKRDKVNQLISNAFLGVDGKSGLVSEENVNELIKNLESRHIDSTSIKESLTKRKKAYVELKSLISRDAPYEDIEDKVNEIVDCDEDLFNDLNKRYGWTELQLLLPQGMVTAYRWRRTSRVDREIGKRAAKKVLVGAPAKAVDAVKKITGVSALKSAEDFRIAARKIDDEAVKFKPKTVDEMNALEKAMNTGVSDEHKLKAARDFHEAKIAEAENKVLSHQSAVYKNRAGLLDAEKELADAKVAKSGAGILEKLEKKVAGLRSELSKSEMKLLGLKNEYFSAERTYMSEYMLNPKRVTVLKADKLDILHSAEIDRFERFGEGMAEHVKQISDQVVEKSRLAEQLAKQGKKAEAEVLLREINDLVVMKDGASKLYWDEIDKAAKRFGWLEKGLKKMLKGETGEKAAKIVERLEQIARQKFAMRSKFKEFLSESRTVFGKKMPRIAKFNGKVAFISMVLVGGVLGRDEQTSFASSAGQMALDVAPITGEVSDFYSVFSGKEMITGRGLDWTDRGIRAAFGVAGLVTDLALVIPFLGEGIKGAYMSGKAGYLAGKVAASAVAKGAAEKAVEKGAAKVVGEVAAKEGSEVAEKLAINFSRAGKVLRKVALVGALGAMGYQMAFKTSGEMDVSSETEEFLGKDVFVDAENVSAGEKSSEAELQMQEAA